jgi:signal transduction histidine kinase/DNA-binding NarL/FixJ family response regulator
MMSFELRETLGRLKATDVNIHSLSAADEAERLRLESLERYELLNTESSETFDRVVELAAYFLGVPSSAISLLSQDKQWFLARKGIEAQETARDIAFCEHTIATQEGSLVVQDALKDVRFHNNPLVTGPMGLRFYAGAALTVADGQRLGALCVIDTAPREFTQREEAVLKHLAQIVVDEFELRRLLREQSKLIAQKDVLARQLSEETRAAQRESERANRYARSRTLFLANMSHEIRTPMNGLIGMAELLMQEPLTSTQSDLVRTLLQSAESLLGILNDVLDLSKLEEGCVRLEALPFNPSDLSHEVIRLQLGRANISFGSLQTRLKDLGCRLGDPTRFRQILNNLLSNAIKFSNGGPIHVHAHNLRLDQPLEIDELWAETIDRCAAGLSGIPWPAPRWLSLPQLALQGDGWFAMVIRDAGIGMSEDQLARLGQAYAQADDSMTRRFGGTGLGLSICTRLVQCMGGGLAFSSYPGRGTLAMLLLQMPPHGQVQASQLDTALSAEPVDANPATRRRLKILLAEDQETNRKVATAHLDSLGCELSVAEDGLKALELSKRNAFDLVLMDIQMPIMSGIDAIKAIRSGSIQNKYVPIVALTASVMAHEREQVLAAGADQVLGKPYRRSELCEVIETWCYAGTSFDQSFWDENYSEFPLSDQQALLQSAFDSARASLALSDTSSLPMLRTTLHRLAGALSLVGYREAASRLHAMEKHCLDAEHRRLNVDTLVTGLKRLLHSLLSAVGAQLTQLETSSEKELHHAR